MAICQPPPRVELLATNDIGPQAFRHGRALATQFHPEVTNEIVARWSSDDGVGELAQQGIDRDDLLARTAFETKRSRAAAHRLVNWYCAELCG